MAKSTPYYIPLDNLDHAPEISTALGEIAVAWSYAESVLLAILIRLLDHDHTVASVVLASVPNYEGRVRLVKNILVLGEKLKHDPEPILDAMEKLRKLAKTRNDYIHNAWYVRQDYGETVQFDYLEQVETPSRKRVIKAVDLRHHAERVRARARSLYATADDTIRGGPSPLLGVIPIPEPKNTPQE